MGPTVIVLDHLIDLPPSPDDETKNKARKQANSALKAGKITRKPCSVCGTKFKVEMHHEDYLKPLDVVWLCRYHHQLRHRELNKERQDEIERQLRGVSLLEFEMLAKPETKTLQNQ